MTKPRPQDDEAMAKIVAWLKEQGLTAHVNIKGAVRLENK
jgi:hypothetical protein